MTRHFHHDLEHLHDSVLSLSAVIEEMIARAGRALCQADMDVLAELRATDAAIDTREVQIEEECLTMLALHQPVAIDLRRITTVLKINNDLERIGDLAVKIAERAQGLHQTPGFPLPARLEPMLETAVAMVHEALNCFVDMDDAAARSICQRDEEVNQLNQRVIAELIQLMKHQPDLVEPAMHCFSATRHLERIADHATNIAEDVIYLVHGEIVRHRHPVDALPE
jgi:phosphate transport system protein